LARACGTNLTRALKLTTLLALHRPASKMVVFVRKVASSLVERCAANKGPATRKTRQAAQCLRARDAKLCELFAPRKEGSSDFWKDSPFVASLGDQQVSVLMVHCGKMTCCDGVSHSWLAKGGIPVQVQAKLGDKGFSVMRESPEVGMTLSSLWKWDKSLAPGNMEPATVAPFDWTCAFLLDSELPLAPVLRVRVRNTAGRFSSRELGRVDLALDLKEAPTRQDSMGRRVLRDAMGRRVGQITLDYEVRQMRLADLCNYGLNLGRSVDAPGLAEVAVAGG